MVSTYYGQWLLAKLFDPDDEEMTFWDDIRAFGRNLLDALARLLHGESSHADYDYVERRQGMYGR
jgi:hypothetical protein